MLEASSLVLKDVVLIGIYIFTITFGVFRFRSVGASMGWVIMIGLFVVSLVGGYSLIPFWLSSFLVALLVFAGVLVE